MKSKGFTLSELLIVVAIIAVLVAIAIPVFTNQLEKSREAADAANIRAMYAEVMAEACTNGENINTDGAKYVDLMQKTSEWQNQTIEDSLNQIFDKVEPENAVPESGGTAGSTLNLTFKRD